MFPEFKITKLDHFAAHNSMSELLMLLVWFALSFLFVWGLLVLRFGFVGLFWVWFFFNICTSSNYRFPHNQNSYGKRHIAMNFTFLTSNLYKLIC